MIRFVCSPDNNNIPNFMQLHISVVDHARKLKFNIHFHLPSINKLF